MTTNTMAADTVGSSIATWVKDLFAKYKQHRQIKSTMRQLEALGDRELWDMGITRGDIYSVAHGTFHREYPDTKANRNLKGWV